MMIPVNVSRDTVFWFTDLVRTNNAVKLSFGTNTYSM